MARKFFVMVRITVTPQPGTKEFDVDDISGLMTDAIDLIQPEDLSAVVEWEFETFEVQEFPTRKEQQH